MGKTLTVEIQHDYVLAALLAEAKERGIGLEQMVAEIVEDWYDDLFLDEDLAAIEAAKREGGEPVPWKSVKKELRA